MATRRFRDGDSVKRRGGAPEERPAGGERMARRMLGAATRMLAARPLSEQQLRQRLIDKGYDDPAALDACMARLKELGFVNDGRFAHGYASYRVRMKPAGRSRLARELAEKKVGRRDIEEALDTVFEETSEEDLLDRAIEKRLRTHGPPRDRRDARRWFDHLARLGFPYDLIIRKLRRLQGGEVEIEG